MPSPQKAPFPPQIAFVFAILAVSTASIFIRYAQREAPSLVIAAFRLTIASLVLAPVVMARYRQDVVGLEGRQLRFALLSGFFLAIHFATWISSLEFTSVASSVVLVSTVPLWVAILSPLTIQERVRRMVFMGMLLAFCGGVIIGVSDVCVWSSSALSCPPLAEFVRGKAFIGDLLALVGALAAAGYFLLGRSLRARMSLVSYIFIVYGVAAFVLVVMVGVWGYPLMGYTPATYGWFLLLALLPQLIGHSTYNWALGYLSAAYVSIALLGEPIGSAILAYFLLDETPSVLKAFGAILILVGIFLASRSESKDTP